ncbi:MAG: DUF2956 domain-containing protein [Halopseudomonas sp.]
MAKYSKQKNSVSEQTQNEATTIARSTQKPGQTKEQTKLVAQGIQKGIEQYKKQQKAKARELDKRLKKVAQPQPSTLSTDQPNSDSNNTGKASALPWVLLLASWVLFAGYVALS